MRNPVTTVLAVSATVSALAIGSCQSSPLTAMPRPALSPVAAAYRAGVPDAVKDIAAINAHKANASHAYMRAHAHACRPIPSTHTIITGATITECHRNRAAALARLQPVDGPGPDTPLERSCVGHEDSLRCAGVEQGDVARHYQATQRSTRRR